jgi:phosphatidylserine/phosphatidylglycerophosphate/cardiolipin synthase-like enzyme/uncharacterized membrane protein YdjX (TVP38/TMEM64 family)
MPDEIVAIEGRNCWKRAFAERASFVVDAAAYFTAFREAAKQARHSILILGWDIDSRLSLLPGDGEGPDDGYPNQLGEFLNRLASEKGIEIYILSWDFAMIYVFERELMPLFRLDWRTSDKLHFRLDGNHPVGASHHQKIIVIDDAIAFSGGLDLTARRWDTNEHIPDDPRRRDPWGLHYHPFHDVQMAVTGEAARSLGDLARSRWRRSAGSPIPDLPQGGLIWPPNLQVDMRDVDIAISRTEPEWKGRKETREVENLFLDMIYDAQAYIYIENQYMTSSRIAAALASRLKEKDGPEVLIVIPRRCSGWLEETTMGLYRTRLLRTLHEADKYNRLRVYFPTTPGLEIHSKVMIVDDRMARVGSANLSNRSMGFDTECDLLVESDGNNRVEEAIIRFRNNLLGEHLGAKPEEVQEGCKKTGSLGEAVEKIQSKTYKLERLDYERDLTEDGVIYCDTTVCDPERPISADRLVANMLPDIEEPPGRGLLSLVALLASLGALAAAWHWTPLGQWIRVDTISVLLENLSSSYFSPLLIMGLFALGGIFIPITLLIIATALVLDPLPGFLVSLLGAVLSASVTFKIGSYLGRDAIRKIAGKRANRVSRKIVRHGFLAVTFLRLAAIAPFTVINLIAGASNVRFRDYILGTVLGMSPGIIAMNVFGQGLIAAIRKPDPVSLGILIAIVLLFFSASIWLSRKLETAPEARRVK